MDKLSPSVTGPETWPLDVVRDTHDFFSVIDRGMLEIPGDEVIHPNHRDMAKLGQMYSRHPWAGREVIISGQVLTYSDGADREIDVVEVDGGGLLYAADFGLVDPESPIYRRPPSTKNEEVRGIFSGLHIAKVIHPELGLRNRLTHQVTVEEINYTSHTGSSAVIFNRKYVCADGATMMPAEPVDQHSFSDIHSNSQLMHFVEIVNDIVSNSDTSKTNGYLTMVKSLGSFIERFIGVDHYGIDYRQAISYVNSLDVFQDKEMDVKTFVAGEVSSGSAFEDLSIIASRNPQIVLPEYFAFNLGFKATPSILSAQKRSVTPQSMVIMPITPDMHNEEIELFVRAQQKGGASRYMVPLSGIVGIR